MTLIQIQPLKNKHPEYRIEHEYQDLCRQLQLRDINHINIRGESKPQSHGEGSIQNKQIAERQNPLIGWISCEEFFQNYLLKILGLIESLDK